MQLPPSKTDAAGARVVLRNGKVSCKSGNRQAIMESKSLCLAIAETLDWNVLFSITIHREMDAQWWRSRGIQNRSRHRCFRFFLLHFAPN